MSGYEEIIKIIGDNIVRLRKEKGLKQVELASRLNIEDSALRRIEKGRTNPTIKTLHAIAKELDIDLVDLIQEKND